MKELTKAEEILLLAIWRLKDNAYGVTIRQMVAEKAKKDYTYGTLYGLLDQLVRKEYVNAIEGEPTRERGGRRKTYYELSSIGIAALKHTLDVQKSVWEGITEFSLDKGQNS